MTKTIEAHGKTKVLSSSSPTFAGGGHNNHMCGKYGSATAKPENFVTQGSGGGWAHGGGKAGGNGNPGRAVKPA